ncbi:hypothetical protein [Aliarcobacter butzleri]|uniref:hypothetical protein n=1 Tax=Aliarcobacter butzleri TaxID=28197 RepID=UPI00263C65F4|nr:hypothetical protein [Aliarcobacter butzleri]MDN5081977.1 hypothetical protein [Aliarcobacter butzleri]MDN5084287.1 hypothetical protein [Aliarcobacter butzleri]
MISIERIKDTKILSLLNYMKTHNKDNPTFFHLKELSAHLELDEDETLKILREAKKLGYIKSSLGIIGEINSQYYITEVGINKTQEYKNTIKKYLKWLITTIAGGIILFYLEKLLGAN